MQNQGLPLHINPKHRYHYSSYWGTISRVLQWPTYNGQDVHFNSMIEFHITPINGLQGNFEELGQIMIRKHGTKFAASDRSFDVIPAHWFQILGTKLGTERRDLMMFGNFPLDRIDWELFRVHNNGGASWFKIRKEQVPA